LFGLLFSYPLVLAPIVLRAVGGFFLIIGIPRELPPGVAEAAIAALGAGISVAVPFGHDGADQMTSIILVVATIARALPMTPIPELCLSFVAAQACLSYFTAGAAKCWARGWRDGTFLPSVLRTCSYGGTHVGEFFARRRLLARVAANGMMFYECAFPLVVLAPRPVVLGWLSCGLAFHVSVAAIMGLNNFVWAFGATYPAIFWCATRGRG
jgi:hypothetical protein